MTRVTSLTLVVSLAVALTGCQCAPPLPGEDDAGLDGGRDGGADGGPVDPKPLPDGGRVYLPSTAAVPCPPGSETFEVTLTDGGAWDAGPLPDGGAVLFGLCVALHTLDGTATLNGEPAKSPIELKLIAGDFQAEAERPTDAFGKYTVRVLKGRYDLLQYHPPGIFPIHEGYDELGAVDLTKDQNRDLPAVSYLLRGSATFANLPFLPQRSPPDITLEAPGLPPFQQVGVTSVGGTYEVRLLKGLFGLYLNVPAAALGGTRLQRWPLTQAIDFQGDTLFDINLEGREVEGHITIDGMPIPDRRQGHDFTLDYTPVGGNAPVAITEHDGALSNIHSLIPSGKYVVNLNLEANPDKTLPTRVYGKQIAPGLDLSLKNQTLDVDLKTFNVEGGILIDGQQPKVVPTDHFTIYMLAMADALLPSSLSYFDVPLDSGSFSLRAFPGNYYVMLALDESLAEDLASGWFLVSRFFPVQQNTHLPISVETAVFDGKILIDGEPPPAGQIIGQFTFRNRDAYFYKTVTANEDGTFRIKVPKGSYEVNFYIEKQTMTEYATGRYRMVSLLELDRPQQLDLDYRTVLVTGPLRVGGEMVPNNTGGPEVGLSMWRRQDGQTWDWSQEGGLSHYRMRIPEGDYRLTFRLERDAFPDTAWGTATMGVTMPVYLPPPPGAPATR